MLTFCMSAWSFPGSLTSLASSFISTSYGIPVNSTGCSAWNISHGGLETKLIPPWDRKFCVRSHYERRTWAAHVELAGATSSRSGEEVLKEGYLSEVELSFARQPADLRQTMNGDSP